VIRQLRHAFDGNEVETFFLVDVFVREIAPNLELKFFPSQFVVVINRGELLRHPRHVFLDAAGINKLGTANNLELVDMIDVNTELRSPLHWVKGARVDA